jgi:hypothetical protein
VQAAGVSSAFDFSSQGRNAVQATGASQPTYRISDTSAPSGLPVIRTDGVAQGMQTSSFSFNPSSFTIFVAGKFPNVGAAALFVEQGPDANATDGFYLYGDGGGINFLSRCSGVNHELAVAADWPGPNFIVACARAVLSPALMTIFKNGVILGALSQSFVSQSSIIPLNIAFRDNGAGTFFTQGDWGEIILYTTSLTDAQVLNVNAYLMKKWGVT